MRRIVNITTLSPDEQNKIMGRIIQLIRYQTGALLEVRRNPDEEFGNWEGVSALMNQEQAAALKNIIDAIAGFEICAVFQSRSAIGQYRVVIDHHRANISELSTLALVPFANLMNTFYPIIDKNKNNTKQMKWSKDSMYVEGYPALTIQYITNAYTWPNQDRTHDPEIYEYLTQLKNKGFDIRYSSSDRYYDYASIPLTDANYQLLMSTATLFDELKQDIALITVMTATTRLGANDSTLTSRLMPLIAEKADSIYGKMEIARGTFYNLPLFQELQKLQDLWMLRLISDYNENNMSKEAFKLFKKLEHPSSSKAQEYLQVIIMSYYALHATDFNKPEKVSKLDLFGEMLALVNKPSQDIRALYAYTMNEILNNKTEPMDFSENQDLLRTIWEKASKTELQNKLSSKNLLVLIALVFIDTKEHSLESNMKAIELLRVMPNLQQTTACFTNGKNILYRCLASYFIQTQSSPNISAQLLWAHLSPGDNKKLQEQKSTTEKMLMNYYLKSITKAAENELQSSGSKPLSSATYGTRMFKEGSEQTQATPDTHLPGYSFPSSSKSMN